MSKLREKKCNSGNVVKNTMCVVNLSLNYLGVKINICGHSYIIVQEISGKFLRLEITKKFRNF